KPLYVKGVIKVPKPESFRATYLSDCKVSLEGSPASNTNGPNEASTEHPDAKEAPAAAVTVESIKKVQAGMTLNQVEQILGKGVKATEEDLRDANNKKREARKRMRDARKNVKALDSVPEPPDPPEIRFRPGTTKYRWGNKKTWIFVDVDDNTSKVVGTEWHS